MRTYDNIGRCGLLLCVPNSTFRTIKPEFEEVRTLIENRYQTACGEIHYWLSDSDFNSPTLAFLPGLTADHRLFDKQVAYFDEKFNIFVWDAPGHASSWPFRFDFDLFDKALKYFGFVMKRRDY